MEYTLIFIMVFTAWACLRLGLIRNDLEDLIDEVEEIRQQTRGD